jgi:hypothetical protein
MKQALRQHLNASAMSYSKDSSLAHLLQSGTVWRAETPQSLHSHSCTTSLIGTTSLIEESTIHVNELQNGERCLERRLHQIFQRLFISGTLHEWFFDKKTSFLHDTPAPLTLLTMLCAEAYRALIRKEAHYLKESGRSYFVWIGRSAWPSPWSLIQAFSPLVSALENSPSSEKESKIPHKDITTLLSRCLFIEANTHKEVAWALHYSLSSPSVITAVGWCETLPLSLSRKLLFAARRGGTLGFFLRPTIEKKNSSYRTEDINYSERYPQSTTHSQWHTILEPSPANHPRWQLTNIRMKGEQPKERTWIVDINNSIHPSYGESLSLTLLPSMASGVNEERTRKKIR